MTTATGRLAPRLDRTGACWRRLALVLLGTISAACATVSPPPVVVVPYTAVLPEDLADRRWHVVRFRMAWAPDAAPQWFVDSLLAQEVVAPVLRRHGGNVSLWRFHRRARHDDAGHQFSFFFYAPSDPAIRISHAIEESLSLKRLQDAGIVASVSAGQWGGPDGGKAVSATSDANWSASMQRAWPMYIEGVSRLWLALIEAAKGATGVSETPEDMDTWLALYRDIDAAVIATWQEEGRHALLHHLNAIFGYEPIPVVERRLLRF